MCMYILLRMVFESAHESDFELHHMVWCGFVAAALFEQTTENITKWLTKMTERTMTNERKKEMKKATNEKNSTHTHELDKNKYKSRLCSLWIQDASSTH